MANKLAVGALLGGVTALALLVPQPAYATTFVVNSTIDAVDAHPGDRVCATAAGACTLRAAVQEANALAGADVITLPAGHYVLEIPGQGDGLAASGDLNVWSDLTIQGSGASTTIIDAAGRDRVFVIFGSVSLALADVTLQNGVASNVTFVIPGDRQTFYEFAYEGSGGAIYNRISGTVRLVRCVVRANVGSGIALLGHNDGGASRLELNETLITENSNGGVSISGHRGYKSPDVWASLSVTNSAVIGNAGSGIDARIAIAHIVNSTISGNRGLFGGGFYLSSNGSAVIERSTISGNTATRDGGGIFTYSPVILVNSTLSGNAAAGQGGAIVAWGTTFTNVTIAGNVSGAAGAVVLHGLGNSATNAIVANNAGAAAANCFLSDDSAALTMPGGHNLEFPGTSCGFTDPTDLHADPLLAGLGSNGGPTQTHALAWNSPAIDAGDDATCRARAVAGVDQRGFARPVAGRCDIGALEAVFTFTDAPLLPTTLIRETHFTELRVRIDALRVRFGLQPVAWSDAMLTRRPVRAVHLQQLRDALTAAYLAAVATGVELAPPSFIDPLIVPGQTIIRRIHIEQLRDAVLILEGV